MQKLLKHSDRDKLRHMYVFNIIHGTQIQDKVTKYRQTTSNHLESLPYSWDMFQNPQQMPETPDSTEPHNSTDFLLNKAPTRHGVCHSETQY